MAYFLVHSLASWLYLSLRNICVAKNEQIKVNLLVRFENSSDFRDQGIVWVWITEERADRKENLADSESRRPLRPEDVQADRAVWVYVGMVNSCCESHLRWLERVVRGKVYGEEEDPTLVGTVRGSHDGCLRKKFFNNNTDRLKAKATK